MPACEGGGREGADWLLSCFACFLHTDTDTEAEADTQTQTHRHTHTHTHKHTGSSGSGKTTLIDCLSGRKTVGKLHGEVFVNDEPRSFQHFKWISGYVMQHDTLYPTLTVRETLVFAANMLLRAPRAERLAQVDAVIHELGLGDAQHSYVGEDMRRGISGGEKKRVSVAIQLIHNPPILFLDEPTTGLDAFNSLLLMRQLKQVAQEHHRCIVASIHQPRSSLFDLFDDIMILSKGSVVYNGPRSSVLSTFARHGCTCPTHVNPADFLVDTVVSSELAWVDGDAEATGKAQAVQALKHEAAAHALPEPVHFPVATSINLQEEHARSHGVGFLKQLYHLTGRAVRTTARNPFSSVAALSQAILFSLFLGATYFHLTHKQQGIQDRCVFVCVCVCMSCVCARCFDPSFLFFGPSFLFSSFLLLVLRPGSVVCLRPLHHPSPPEFEA